MKVQDFAKLVRSRKPEYEHLDDTDLMQMVSQRKPELLKNVDTDDLALTMKEARKKKVSRERQKAFKSLSGVSRFGIGVEHGIMDTFMGIKQLLSGQKRLGGTGYSIENPGPVSKDEGYEDYKQEYMETSKGDVSAGAGELAGALLATAPIPGATGAKLAGKVASPLLKGAIKTGTAAGVGAGFGAGEYVDEDETRLKNTVYGALFGAGGAAAGMLLKKLGTKGYNALKGRMKDANSQELFDLSKKYDIPLTKGDITGEGRMTEKALESIPGIGMGGFRKKGAEKVQTAIKKEAGKISDDWDKTIQKSLQSKVKAGKEQAKINYDKLEKMAGDASVKPENSLQKAIKHEEDVAGSILGSETNPFTKIRENLSKKDRTFSDLRKDRSDLGKAARKAADSGDRNLARQLNDIKAGVEKDLEKVAGGKKELKEAYNVAQSQYKKEVIPYTDKKILNDLKTESPDKIYSKYIKKGSGDDARNFYKLLDEKGKKALRDGFLDNAIIKPDGSYNSPAKIAGYIERMAKPGQAIFKSKDLDELKGFAKIMRHAERYGQINEAPSTGLGLIPFIKGGALAGAGYGSATSPLATGIGVLSAGALTKLMSLMKTKGAKFSLADSKIGSEAFEKTLEKIMKQLPKTSAVIGKEVSE